MPEYRVGWTVDVDASDPTAAALLARRYQSPGTSAVVFEVTPRDGGDPVEIDLGTGPDQVEPAELADSLVARYLAEEAPTGAQPNPRVLLRVALADYTGCDPAGPKLTRAEALATAAERVLAWMDAAAVDPGDPPPCGCGAAHWTCPGDTPADGVGDLLPGRQG